MPPRKLIVFASTLDGGGSERQTLTLLRRLDRSEWSPHLMLLYRKGVLLSEVPADVPVHAFWDSYNPPKIWIPGRIHRQQVSWLRNHLLQIQPSVIYDRTYHSTLITGPATSSLPIGRISTITSPPDVELVPSREKWIWLKRNRLARAYRDASFTVAVSKAAASSAEKFYGLKPDSIVVVPNPIDLEAVRAAALKPPSVEFDSAIVNVLCVDRMTEEKGHQILLDAVRLLVSQENVPKFHLWLAGDGPLRSSLEAFVQNAGINERVTFLGHVPEAVRLIACASLLCLPSMYEGLPNVVMESMAVGTPIIATDAGGTPELSDQGRLFELVPPNNAPALAAALKQFLCSPSREKNSVEAAKLAIESRDWSVVFPVLNWLLHDAVHCPEHQKSRHLSPA